MLAHTKNNKRTKIDGPTVKERRKDKRLGCQSGRSALSPAQCFCSFTSLCVCAGERKRLMTGMAHKVTHVHHHSHNPTQT